MRRLGILNRSHKKFIILVITILLGAVVFWIGLRIALRTELPLLAVDSTGMHPALDFGDLMIVQGVKNASEVSAMPDFNGDIIIFRKPSEPAVLITSRAVNKTFQGNSWYIRTQADESELPDRWLGGQNPEDTWGNGLIHQKFIVGKVVGRIPYLGYFPLYVSEFVRTPAAIFLFVALVFLVILLKYPSLLKRAKTFILLF